MTMARRKRGKRRRGVGSVIQVRRLSGVERLNNPSSMTGAVMPALIGGGVTVLTTMGVRQFLEPTPDNATIIENADWIGLAAGSLAGLALWNMASKPAGIAALATSAVVSLAALVPSWMASANGAAPPAGMRGLRAIVPEYSVRGLRGGHGTRGIVMEPAASRGYGAGQTYGSNVRLGNVNPGAFGTPTFRR
jgi:hypothetical protein